MPYELKRDHTRYTTSYKTLKYHRRRKQIIKFIKDYTKSDPEIKHKKNKGKKKKKTKFYFMH